MDLMIKWLFDLVGEYGITIVISVIIMQLIVFPFQFMAVKNKKKKQGAEKHIKAIQKKYGINPVGGYSTKNVSADILAMSNEEKDERAAAEIEAVYRETNYKPIISSIPIIIKTVLIVLFYLGISKACPDGIYKSSISTGTATTYLWIVVILNLVLCLIKDNIFPTIDSIKNAKDSKAKCAAWIGAGIGFVLSIGLALWVSWKARLSTLLAILIFRVLNVVIKYIAHVLQRNSEQDVMVDDN